MAMSKVEKLITLCRTFPSQTSLNTAVRNPCKNESSDSEIRFRSQNLSRPAKQPPPFHIESGHSQGFSSNSLADFLFSGSHWSIFCTKMRNFSLPFPSRESTEPPMLEDSEIRSWRKNAPGSIDYWGLTSILRKLPEIFTFGVEERATIELTGTSAKFAL